MKIIKPVIVEIKERFPWSSPKLVAESVILANKLIQEELAKGDLKKIADTLPFAGRRNSHRFRRECFRLAEDLAGLCVEVVQYGQRIPTSRVSYLDKSKSLFFREQWFEMYTEFKKFEEHVGLSDEDKSSKYEAELKVRDTLEPIVFEICNNLRETWKIRKNVGEKKIKGWAVYNEGKVKAGFVHFCGMGQSYVSKAMDRNVKCKKCGSLLDKVIRGALFISEQKVS